MHLKEVQQPFRCFAPYFFPYFIMPMHYGKLPYQKTVTICMVCLCTGVNGTVVAGTPRSSLPLAQIIDQACQEAEAYKDAGVVSPGFPLPMAVLTQSCFCVPSGLN